MPDGRTSTCGRPTPQSQAVERAISESMDGRRIAATNYEGPLFWDRALEPFLNSTWYAPQCPRHCCSTATPRTLLRRKCMRFWCPGCCTDFPPWGTQACAKRVYPEQPYPSQPSHLLIGAPPACAAIRPLSSGLDLPLVRRVGVKTRYGRQEERFWARPIQARPHQARPLFATKPLRSFHDTPHSRVCHVQVRQFEGHAKSQLKANVQALFAKPTLQFLNGHIRRRRIPPAALGLKLR